MINFQFLSVYASFIYIVYLESVPVTSVSPHRNFLGPVSGSLFLLPLSFSFNCHIYSQSFPFLPKLKPSSPSWCINVVSSVQSLSCVWLFATPWIAACQASLSITDSQSSLRLTSIESVMPSSHLIFCRTLLLLPQSLSASESFPMSQLFTWGGQSTGVSALASFPSKKSQGWSPSEWTGWISL